ARRQRSVRLPGVRHPLLRPDQGERMSELALRYSRSTPRHDVQVSVPQGAVTRLHLPDDDAKAHLVTAMLKARTEPGEDLELFGESTAALDTRQREKIRSRIGALSPIVGL